MRDARLDWYGCATFRLTLEGPPETVVFLDAYLDRVPAAAPVGLIPEQVDRADWILVGHSHFDHAWGAERIALRTGATIVGSYETARIMAAQGVPEAQLLPVAGGERLRLADGVFATVIPSLHSCVWSNPAMPASGQVCLGDLGVLHHERLERFAALMGRFTELGADVVQHLVASHQGARGDGGALVFLIETPLGSLLYQDTSGHWTGLLRGLRPDLAIVAAAGRGNVDGEPIQGSLAQFVADEVALLGPRRVVLSHHDDWLPGFSSAVDVAPIRDAIARRIPAVELVETGYGAGLALFASLPGR